MIGVWYGQNSKKLNIVLKSYTCSWNKCSFCSFSDEATYNYTELQKTNFSILKYATKINHDYPVDEMVIFNGGSFFELPYEIVLKISDLTKNKIINIESRPDFVSEKNILKTLAILKPKQLIVRLGFESFFSEVRKTLNKNIPSSEIPRIQHLRKILETKNVKFITYVLFGMDKIDERSVMTSVKKFNKIFNGVIAIKYKKFKRNMPERKPPTPKLINFLKNNCLDLDMTEDKLWELNKKRITFSKG